MLNDDDYKKFGLIPGTLKPDRTIEKGNSFFKAQFSPPYPMVEKYFKARRFTYRGSSDTVGVFARTPPKEIFFVQIGLVMPRGIKTGEYDIGKVTDDGPRGHFLANRLHWAETGKLKIVRDNNRQTIGGDFDMNFEHEGVDYRLYGKFFLNATDPL